MAVEFTNDSPIQRETLVRESIAHPCMCFQKSSDINMDIQDFWMAVFNYPYKREISTLISMQGHSAMDKQCFYGCQSSIIHAFVVILRRS